jgi:hypothetical protein
LHHAQTVTIHASNDQPDYLQYDRPFKRDAGSLRDAGRLGGGSDNSVPRRATPSRFARKPAMLRDNAFVLSSGCLE